MELAITQTDKLPANHVVSFRFGDVRRQVPAERLQQYCSFKFPCRSTAFVEPLKIEVLHVVAATHLVLKPYKADYVVAMDHPIEGQDAMGMDVRVRWAGDAGNTKGHTLEATGDEVVEPIQSSRGGGGQEARSSPEYRNAANSARDYLQKHGLLQYVQALLQAVIQAKPDDPYVFLLWQLQMHQGEKSDKFSGDVKTSSDNDDCAGQVPPEDVFKVEVVKSDHAENYPKNDAPMDKWDCTVRECDLVEYSVKDNSAEQCSGQKKCAGDAADNSIERDSGQNERPSEAAENSIVAESGQNERSRGAEEMHIDISVGKSEVQHEVRKPDEIDAENTDEFQAVPQDCFDVDGTLVDEASILRTKLGLREIIEKGGCFCIAEAPGPEPRSLVKKSSAGVEGQTPEGGNIDTKLAPMRLAGLLQHYNESLQIAGAVPDRCCESTIRTGHILDASDSLDDARAEHVPMPGSILTGSLRNSPISNLRGHTADFGSDDQHCSTGGRLSYRYLSQTSSIAEHNVEALSDTGDRMSFQSDFRPEGAALADVSEHIVVSTGRHSNFEQASAKAETGSIPAVCTECSKQADAKEMGCGVQQTEIPARTDVLAHPLPPTETIEFSVDSTRSGKGVPSESAANGNKFESNESVATLGELVACASPRGDVKIPDQLPPLPPPTWSQRNSLESASQHPVVPPPRDAPGFARLFPKCDLTCNQAEAVELPCVPETKLVNSALLKLGHEL